MNLFGKHIFCQSPSCARYSFYQPTEGWKAESTCWQWGSNSPPFAQDSDTLLTELSGQLFTFLFFFHFIYLSEGASSRGSKGGPELHPSPTLHLLKLVEKNGCVPQVLRIIVPSRTNFWIRYWVGKGTKFPKQKFRQITKKKIVFFK